MSEARSAFFKPTFNRSVQVRARDQRLSSDGGVLLLREVDGRLGLIDSIASRLFDPRERDRIRYHLDELLRERIFSRALGYNADDEVDLLAHDPAMRIATWNRPGDRVLEERCASQLRFGSAHTATGAVRFIRNAVARASDLARSLDVRLDAGFTMGRVMDPLTENGIRFVGRLATNNALEEKAQPHLRRPVGRPPKEGYERSSSSENTRPNRGGIRSA